MTADTRKNKSITRFYSSVMRATLIIYAFIPSISYGETDLDVRGFVDTYHAVRVKAPNDYLSSRTRLRMEMMSEIDTSCMFVSFNAVQNDVLSENTGIKLREAYIEYTSESWDFRAGKQIIMWGKADGIMITDKISPADYSEFLARDYDDIRMPVNAVKFRALGSNISAEFIWLPTFKASVIPSGDNPWAVDTGIADDDSVDYNDLLPENTFRNSEFAGKLSLYLSGIDIALSAFYTRDDMPVMYKTYLNETDNVIYKPQHYRLAIFGIEFSKPVNSFVLRGEAAFYKGKRFETDNGIEGIFKKESLNWLAGLDWYPGGNWIIMGQLSDYYIFDYTDRIKDKEHSWLSTLNVSKKMFRETLTLSSMAYMGLNDSSVFDRSCIDYALSDALHFKTGLDVFFGDSGFIGQYKDNTEVWIKAKYSF